MEDNSITIENQDLESNPFSIEKPKKSKLWIILLSTGLIFTFGGVALFLLVILKPVEEQAALVFPTLPTEKAADTKIYSAITGEEIADASLNSLPVYCMQTPNGLDGARPQAGINQAGVIFEAIAEAGITRFAAIYQNPTSAVIGPIRSLRLYYLQWDTPFDCTITHAGGAYDAIEAVRYGGYKDLSEDYAYMYRGTITSRLWNNLFTTSDYLKQFTNDHGYTASNPQGFTRLTTEEAKLNRINTLASNKLDIHKPTYTSTATLTPKVTNIKINFGGWNQFNPLYIYNENTNSYDRFYASGEAHEVYNCPGESLGEKNPESVCELKQLSPSVVIAMFVEERKASDNYHEDITAVGSGKAYVFQNGTAIAGTWYKASVGEQIKFYDENGTEISLVPGQTWVSAVPNYGGIEY